MNAHSSAFGAALKEALSQSHGNRPPPAVVARQSAPAPDPVFAAMFRHARARAHEQIKRAQSLVEFDPRSHQAVTALQSAQHQLEEVERQIIVARELVSLAQHIGDGGNRFEAMAASLAKQAAQ